MAYKHYLRELLGLAVIISVVFGVLGILLDIFALTAWYEHQNSIANTFFHESFYFVAFLIPPFFLWRIINRPTLVSATQEYKARALELERAVSTH